ncbi:glycosyltransferase family 2 protein [Polynucleobacter necessarius]|uniref:glycosyltransferase family 2 protein n=1 Tax=Polynucleobacter necessarius TaxID=576610 RepID=UPI000E092688|nr:glycosyltransferase family A protein [Polynucleobacter necessarius]
MRADQAHPEITVVLPTYNRSEFIGDAIRSVLAQTYTKFELIIVDDGSGDDTESIVKTFSDPRIIYCYQPNSGRSIARNNAIAIARGKYIAFIDSDDMYLPRKLEIQYRLLERTPSTDMVYTSAKCINRDGSYLSQNYRATISGAIYTSIAFFRPVTIILPTVMLRKSIFNQIGNFDQNMNRFEDTDMWRRVSKVSHIVALPEFTCLIRTHEQNSLATQDPRSILEALRYYSNKILSEDRDAGALVIRMGLGRLYCYYATAFLTVSGWHGYSKEAFNVGFQFWPPIAIKYYLTKLKHSLI